VSVLIDGFGVRNVLIEGYGDYVLIGIGLVEGGLLVPLTEAELAALARQTSDLLAAVVAAELIDSARQTSDQEVVAPTGKLVTAGKQGGGSTLRRGG